MSKYEGMFIFPDRLKEEETDEVLKGVRAEIEKHGGKIVSSVRLGRRPFSRVLKNESHGHYAVVVFDIDGREISALQARFKLNEQIMRVQIVCATDAPVVAAAVQE